MPRTARSLRPAAGARSLTAGALLLFVGAAACNGRPGPGEGADPSFVDGGDLVDLTHAFGSETLYWPTNLHFELTVDAAGPGGGGDWYASNSFRASEHGGTHIDAPYHFHKTGWKVDEIPIESLVAPAVVIDVSDQAAVHPDHKVSAADIEAWEEEHGPVPAGSVVLLRTGWSERWPDLRAYLGDDRARRTDALHFPGLGADGARLLVRREVVGVGLDTASLDPGTSTDFSAHRILAAANIYGLENLARLEALPPTGVMLMALPMKIAGGTGSPVRVLALLP